MIKSLIAPHPPFRQFPELETDTLRLIEITPRHAEDVLHHFSDDAVTRYLDIQCMQTLDEARGLINFLTSLYRKGQGIRWGITRRGEDQIIGTCGFNTWHRRKSLAELGYDLSAAYWRQGIATDAVGAVLHFGFTEMSLQSIEALVMPDNLASEGFLDHLGFRWQRNVRDFQISRGQYTTMSLFHLKKYEWLGQLVNLPLGS